MVKACPSCKLEKPLGSFHRNRSASDGHQKYCKGCRKEHYSRFMQDPEHGTARRRSRRAGAARRNRERPELDRRCDREHRARHPERVRARRKLRNAVEFGSVVKPNVCSSCKCPTSPRRLHGHHEDYAKPLEVEWLCAECHYAHTLERQAKGETDG